VVDQPDQMMRARDALRERRRVSLPSTATPRSCTSKRPRRRSALDTVTVLERLGSERSTLGSSIPKPSGSKPKRRSGQPAGTAGRAPRGRRLLAAARVPLAVHPSALRPARRVVRWSGSGTAAARTRPSSVGSMGCVASAPDHVGLVGSRRRRGQTPEVLQQCSAPTCSSRPRSARRFGSPVRSASLTAWSGPRTSPALRRRRSDPSARPGPARPAGGRPHPGRGRRHPHPDLPGGPPLTHDTPIALSMV
jgi:hypothetical protein